MKTTIKRTMALVACTAGMSAMADGSPWDEPGGMVDIAVLELSSAKNLIFAPGLNANDAGMRQAADHLCRGTGRGVVADYTLRELSTVPGQKVQLHFFRPNAEGLTLQEQTVTAVDSIPVLDRVYCIDDDRAVRARPEPRRNLGTVALQYFEQLKADGVQTRHLTDEYDIKPGVPDRSLITDRLRQRLADRRDEIVGQTDLVVIDLSNLTKKFSGENQYTQKSLEESANQVCRALGLGSLGDYTVALLDTNPGQTIDLYSFDLTSFDYARGMEMDLVRTPVPGDDFNRVLNLVLKKVACIESPHDQNGGVLARAYQVALSDQGMTETWMRLDDPSEFVDPR